MTSPIHTSRQARVAALDGLRGAAMVLVVLNHGFALWDVEWLERAGPWGNVFRSGNLAVSVFLVVGGYLLTRGLLAAMAADGRIDVPREAVRRVVRIGAPVYALVVAVTFMAVMDGSDHTPVETTRSSVWHLMTFTWNWFLMDHPQDARPDLGHMWFVSVFLHATLLILVLVAVLGRRRVVLGLTLLALLLLVMAWRSHVADTEGWFRPLLRTTTRIDGMLWGALAALVEPWVRRRLRAPALTLLAGLAAVVTLVLTLRSSDAYLRWPGQVLCLALVAVVLGVGALPAGHRAVRALGWRPTAWLGLHSMPIYVWHHVVFFAVARHTQTWEWLPRTVVGLLAAAAVAFCVYWLVERPVGRLLTRWRSERGPLPTRVRTVASG